jgi:hypothetical protein
VVESSRSGTCSNLGFVPWEKIPLVSGIRAPALHFRGFELGALSLEIDKDDNVTTSNSSLPMSSGRIAITSTFQMRICLHSSTHSARFESTSYPSCSQLQIAKRPLSRTDREKASRIQSQSFDKTSLSSV